MNGLTKKLILSVLTACVLGFGAMYNKPEPVNIDSSGRNKAVIVTNEKKTPAVPAVVIGENVKAEKLLGRAFAVYDGDTCKLEISGGKVEKLRFAHIDAPEKKQRGGLEAQKFLANMIDGRDITVIVNTTDRYGRKVADVYYDGHYVNAEMVKNGYAWHYKSFDKPGSKVYQDFQDLEQQARRNRLGIWSDNSPEPPWEYRKRGK